MKNQRFALKVTVLVSMILLTLLGSVAPAAAQDSIETVTISKRLITWTPQVENNGMILTISGPDFYLQQEYAAGTRPTFKPYDGQSKQLADGLYTYELQLLPVLDKAVQSELDQAQRGLVPIVSDDAVVLSGSFSILDGNFVTQDVPESGNRVAADVLAPEDILHYDDVIITGSLCVGFDCQDGESFGFDTQILKEHNLRIYFNDTSYTASYPTNNWRITINDSTNGGASYFSIDDVDDGTSPFRVEAGAPSYSLYVEDYGRVGLGTSTPVVEMHIKDSDTPTVRLEQDGSGGWTPQTWDVAGNESNFFIRDATNGSKLPFRIQPNTPSSTLNLKSSGYVGIGTWSPDQPLHVQRSDGTAKIKVEEVSGTATGRFLLSLMNNGAARMQYTNTDSDEGWNVGMIDGDDYAVWEKGTSSKELRLDTSGNLTIRGTLSQGSNVNAKEGFAAVNGQEILATLADLPITSWSFKSDSPDVRHLGPTAQDFYRAFGLGEDELHIAPLDVASVALVAIQNLDTVVAEKDARIRALEEHNADLEVRLTALEQGRGASLSFSAVILWALAGILLGVGFAMSKLLVNRVRELARS